MSAQLWAGVDLVATACALAAMVALHVLPTGLLPTRNPVSQYGISRYRQGYRVLTVALGAAGLAAAAVIGTSTPIAQQPTIVALLVVFGVCRLAISWWPMDPPGHPRSGTGTVHLALAVGAFGSITAAAGELRRSAPQLHQLAGVGHGAALGIAFWLLLVGIAAMVLAQRLDQRWRYFGAAERVVYAGIYVLLIAIGVSSL